jgi:hypothetical protein
MIYSRNYNNYLYTNKQLPHNYYFGKRSKHRAVSQTQKLHLTN